VAWYIYAVANPADPLEARWFSVQFDENECAGPPTLALLEYHEQEQARSDTSVYGMWRKRRAK